MLDVAKQKESNKFKSTRYVDPTVISQVNRYQEGPVVNDVKKIFEKFLDTLNEKERKIMILRSQGASNLDIAKNADSTEGTVKWYVSNLMKRFKKFLEENK
jgi:DNA-binding NarL/FixJ family response regulator